MKKEKIKRKKRKTMKKEKKGKEMKDGKMIGDILNIEDKEAITYVKLQVFK